MHDCMTWSPEEQVVYHCSAVHVAWKMYIQIFPTLCSFKLCSSKELKKENNNIVETNKQTPNFSLWEWRHSETTVAGKYCWARALVSSLLLTFGDRALILFDALLCCFKCYFGPLLPIIVTGECLSDKNCGGPAHKRKPINSELKIKIMYKF
jgi:hypothetical protein